MKKTILLMTAAMMTAITSAFAAPLDFSYNFDATTSEYYGTGKAETYDVAIRLANPSFTGATVTGIRVPLMSEATAEASVWLSSELKLKKVGGKNVNNPDITSQTAEIADGWLNVTFNTPYVVPEEGVYVGYSFTVTDAETEAAKPVAVVAGENPDAFYLHTSRTKLRWGSMTGDTGMVSAMTVTLDGDFTKNAAYISFPETPIGEAGKPFEAKITLTNGCLFPISSFDYEYTIDGVSETGSVTLDSELPGHICASMPVVLTFDAVDKIGQHDLSVRVTKINGVDATGVESSTKLEIYPLIPVNRPLVEEYTGLWCGWCPRGYVALETMRELHGDLFVGVAYHNGDDMGFGYSTPNHPSGFPAGYINRGVDINLGQIYTIWDTYRTNIPDADVAVNVEWTDDSHSAIKATAKTRFVKDFSDAKYRVSYILVADGLSDPSWKQHNSYAPKNGEEPKDHPDMPGELGRIFTHGEEYVKGLTFNDVAVAATDYDGFPESIPSALTAGETYSHSYVFNLGEIENKAVLSVPDKLRVIAVITNGKSGKPINCASSPQIGQSGIGAVGTATAEVVECQWFDLQGRRVIRPAEGIYILRETLSDGSTRTSKKAIR